MSAHLNLSEAQREREARADVALDAALEGVFDALDEKLSEADKVGPHARQKLKPILRKYAKSPTPFRTCVRDQLKNGLPRDMANRRCAVLKDIIEGTTKWRGRKTPMKPKAEYLLSDECPLINFDDEMTQALDAYAKLDIPAALESEHLAVLDAKKRGKLPASDFALPSQRRYPIHDRAHGANALARAKGKPEYPQVKGAVCKRYSDLPECKSSGAKEKT